MMSPSTEELNAARFRGDELVKKLIADMESDGLDREGYNRLMNLMDRFLESPELLMVEDSWLARAFRRVPDEFRDYFDPQPAPSWVDEARLARASDVWERNTLGLLIVLYVGSLPACYLAHRGITALYRTSKLANRETLPQRLYETALMVDAVLDAGGMHLIEERTGWYTDVMTEALRRSGLDAAWRWNGNSLQPQVDQAGTGGGPPIQLSDEEESRLRQTLEIVGQEIPVQRYVWGRGLLAARKVRFLHGFIRRQLQPSPPPGAASASGGGPRPGASSPARVPAWDTASLGLPINQEDLAYTLLTFGYSLPAGLAKLGCPLSREDREAFLHLWRLVGHEMGLEAGLMTDNWDEAEELFLRIKAKEGGASDQGKTLTATVIVFLETIFPSQFGLNRLLPVMLVADQLGDDAPKLLSPDLLARTQTVGSRLVFAAVKAVLWTYFRLRQLWFWLFPDVPVLFAPCLHRISEELIASMWAGYERQPFYLPKDLTTWRRDPKAGPAFEKRLKAWRGRIFDLLFVGLALLLVAVVAVTGALGLACFLRWEAAKVAALVALLGFGGFFAVAQWALPALCRRRPRPVGELKDLRLKPSFA